VSGEGIENIVIPPTHSIREAVKEIDRAIGRYDQALASCRDIGKYEWEVESRLLSFLSQRNLEAILVLATKDLCLLSPALSLARNCFELAIRALWMVLPEKPFDREARFLAHLKTEEDALSRELQLMAASTSEGEYLARRVEAIRSFRLGVTSLLP
jgi:hypothetical protein